MQLVRSDIESFLNFKYFKIKHKLSLDYGVIVDFEYVGYHDMVDNEILIIVSVDDGIKEWNHSLSYHRNVIVNWLRREKIKIFSND